MVLRNMVSAPAAGQVIGARCMLSTLQRALTSGGSSEIALACQGSWHLVDSKEPHLPIINPESLNT